MGTLNDTLTLFAEKLKTIDSITESSIDLKTQQPARGVSASVALVSRPYNVQRKAERYQTTVTLRAAESYPVAEFYELLEQEGARSVFNLFRGPYTAPVRLSNGAAVIIENVRNVELRAPEPGGAVVRRCVFDALVML